MKKIFTLLALAMFVFASANAQSRKTWDFRHWSASTLSALKADLEINGPTKNWRNYESDATKADEQHYWIARKMAGTLVTNDGQSDKVIPETEGITFGASNAKKLVISYNHNNKGEDGGSFLWFNGKNETLSIPDVVGGQVLHVAIESHSGSEARGFSITFNGNSLKPDDPEKANFVPLEYTEYDVTLPEGQGSLDFKTTNGCHLYYIIFGEGDAPKTYNVAYLWNKGVAETCEALPLYNALTQEGVTFTGIDVAEANAEELQTYDAVVLDGSIEANESNVAKLKNNIQWQPVLNVNADLAEAFGYGTKVAMPEGGESEMVYVKDIKKSWFSNCDIIDDMSGEGDWVYGATSGEVFPTPLILQGSHASDPKFAVWLNGNYEACNDSVIAYVHNNGHNQYVYYGVPADYAEGTEVILQNILADVISSKSKVEATATPVIKGAYKEMETTISISNVNKNAVIYYTINGTDPTTESRVYTEPIVFTETATVKAMAVADGYTESAVVSFDVELYHQAADPIITIAGNPENEDAVITLSSEQAEEVDIYYNFTNSTDPARSSIYTEPLTIKTAATINVFAIGKEGAGLVQSNTVTRDIEANMLKVRRDVLAHFAPAPATWGDASKLKFDGEPATISSGSTMYYFSWGKNAVQSYENGEPVLDDEGNPTFDDTGNQIFQQIDREPSIATCDDDEDWKCVSQGQVMIYQTLSKGNDVGNGEGYNPERAESLIDVDMMTANDIQCGGKVSGDKYTARVESTKKFQAPFNIKVFAGTSNANEKLAAQISEDGKTWETVGDTISMPATKRLWTQFEVNYEGTNEVYVRVAHVASGSAAMIYDIYVLNEGEESKAKEEAYKTGIDEIVDEAPVNAFSNAIYNIAGQKVGNDYKGLIIMNGKKYFNK